MEYLAILEPLLYHLLYPFFLISKWIAAILLALGAPLVHLGSFVLHGCLWPLRFLAQFETLYIFLGVALLIGIATGTTLHYTSSFLAALMKLESRPQEPPRGRTMASHRVGRTGKLQQKTTPRPSSRIAASPRLADTTSADDFAKLLEREKRSGRRSLLTSTILEEDDSTDGGL
ncbi:hypothetical protein XPA_007715 [Xanthoria parietina]